MASVFYLPRRRRPNLCKLVSVGVVVSCLILWSRRGLQLPRPSDHSQSADQLQQPDVRQLRPVLDVGSIGEVHQLRPRMNVIQQPDTGSLDASPSLVRSRSIGREVSSLLRFDRQIDDDLLLIDPELGHDGEAASLQDPGLQKLAEDRMIKEAFNIVLSDRISPNRSVPDARSPLCLKRSYDVILPTASVVIIFNNEAFSPLIRTIHSVINRTPARLLHQIILVDDFSDRVELGGKLERYIERFFNNHNRHVHRAASPAGGAAGEHGLVRLIRLPRRSGLIRARLAGARAATGDVLVFLDSHCECGVQWMEPMLQRIKEQRTAVLTPIIDVIDDKTLQYYHSNGEFFQVGGFTWSGHFTWIDVPEWEIRRRGSAADPTRSPTMAGGLFAIDRGYFWESGSYDEGMDVWGGENLEMSFRIWMCGGSVEAIPCSRVGHIFRDFHPYTFPGNKDTHGINTARLAEVWMDDYKRLFYLNRPDLLETDIGSTEERKLFRRRKRCKSFKWYLDNVLPQKFILDENVQAYGKTTNNASSPHVCLDTMQNNEDATYNLGLYNCHSFMAASQLFSLSEEGELRREETCAEVHSTADTATTVRMAKCSKKSVQRWVYQQGGQLRHVSSGLCLDRRGRSSGDDVTAATCLTGASSQRWYFDARLKS